MSIYSVVKDGQTVKSFKSLSAAKKLADSVEAEIFCDCECVYQGVKDASAAKYRLKALMNVRKEPRIESEKLGQKPAGTEVAVLALEGDWLKLEEGGYILFSAGKFAEKI